MSIPELAIDTTSIVIRGVFDPTKLSSQELDSQGLVSSEDLLQASQKFSTNDISIIETKAMRLLANRDLIQLTTQQGDEFAPLRDLAVNMLRWLKDESVAALGINRDSHFATNTISEWHAVGDSITPKNIWRGVLENVGMASVTLQAARPDLYVGYQQITVQPSSLVAQGIFVSHNDHYTLDIAEQVPSSRDQVGPISRQPLNATEEKISIAIRVLNEEWSRSMSRAESVVERVARQAQS